MEQEQERQQQIKREQEKKKKRNERRHRRGRRNRVGSKSDIAPREEKEEKKQLVVKNEEDAEVQPVEEKREDAVVEEVVVGQWMEVTVPLRRAAQCGDVDEFYMLLPHATHYDLVGALYETTNLNILKYLIETCRLGNESVALASCHYRAKQNGDHDIVTYIERMFPCLFMPNECEALSPLPPSLLDEDAHAHDIYPLYELDDALY